MHVWLSKRARAQRCGQWRARLACVQLAAAVKVVVVIVARVHAMKTAWVEGRPPRRRGDAVRLIRMVLHWGAAKAMGVHALKTAGRLRAKGAQVVVAGRRNRHKNFFLWRCKGKRVKGLASPYISDGSGTRTRMHIRLLFFLYIYIYI